MSNKIYRIKDGVNTSDFEKLGYTIIEEPQYFLIKATEQPWESDLVQAKFEYIYSSPEWKKRFYDGNEKLFLKTLHLKYDKDGSVVLSKQFKKMLQSWLIQIDFDGDGWVCFTSVDPNDRNTYYNKESFDKYFKDEIDFLLNADLIEDVEVEG